ncbi:interferon a3 [Lates calcarifer]|uniref:Interferon a3 n=1 Tax=Lates calcarifer TaxID=8187 RepID=A0A4W6EYP6_LATCA|nr:interferon a3 [Lates calcarifer]
MLETLILSSAHIFIFITFIMISSTVLFLLCAALAPALCCDWLTHYSRHSNISRTLILQMGDPLTTEESKVSFPYRLYKDIRNTEVESQLVFIRDSLELILNLYHHDNHSSIAWDTDKMDHFLMSVDRQIDGLNTCVSMNKRADSRLRKYYRRLEKRTLYLTGGAPASWELIRKETKLHLDQLELLVASIRAATRRRRSTPTHHQH